MPDVIRPALTPEEWAAVEDERLHPENYAGRPHKPLTGISISYTDGTLPTGYALANPFTPHALIALINAALPDDDPRKITREHMNAISNAGRQYYTHVDDLHREGFHADAERAQRDAALIERLVAILAALLPPE